MNDDETRSYTVEYSTEANQVIHEATFEAYDARDAAFRVKIKFAAGSNPGRRSHVRIHDVYKAGHRGMSGQKSPYNV